MSHFLKCLLFRLVSVVFFLSMHSSLMVAQSPTDDKLSTKLVSLSLKGESIAKALLVIEGKTGCTFAYDVTLIENSKKKINLNVKDKPMTFVLDELTQQTGLHYSLEGTTVTLYSKLPAAEKVAAKPGSIKGQIVDTESGETIIGVVVIVKNTSFSVVTDKNGEYNLSLDPGSYDLEYRFVGYQTKVIQGVNVKAGGSTPLPVALDVNKSQLSEVVITAEYSKASVEGLMSKRKNNVSMSDGISAEQMKALPDNNLGQVLKRVSGLTIQDNKFVTVRGMSERYNNVQLNGGLLPSTEPNRRNFSFDIIPSNLVDNVVVLKTFSPDLPAEFSGGMVQVNTIDIPKEKFLSLSAGTGINNNSTGKAFRSTQRFTSDYFAGGTERSWYNSKFDATAFGEVYSSGIGNLKDDAAFAKMAAFNTQIPNHWGLYQFTAKPMQSYSVSGGIPYQLGKGNQIGLIAAITYRHEETIEDYDAMFRNKEYETTDNAKKYNFTTAVGAVGNIAWVGKGQKIAWHNLYNRRFSLSTNEMDMGSDLENVMYYEYYSSALINTLWQTRLEGEHQLFDNHIRLSWFADQNHLKREQPDDHYSSGEYNTSDSTRMLKYDLGGSSIKGGYLFASAFEETKKNIGGNMEFSAKMAGKDQKIKIGYMSTRRKVEYEHIGLKIFSRNTGKYGGYTGLPDYLTYATANFQNDLYYYVFNSFVETGGSQYAGKHEVQAAFAMADLYPLRWLRFTGGYRAEKSVMDVRTLTRYFKTYRWVDSTVTYTETVWLPAATVIASLTSKLNLRGAYGKTLARPDLRERSAYKYYDVNERADIMGNGGLVPSYSNNYDIRIEWYPAPGEVLSAGVFYKRFEKPVEMVANPLGSYGFGLFYFNLDNATTRGAEFDLRKSLGFIAPGSAFLSRLYVSANATLMEGEVNYNVEKLMKEAEGSNEVINDSAYSAKRKRPLQGMAPYVINGGIGYQGEKVGFNVSYNRTGNIMVLAGTNSSNDEYELGRDVVDMQISYKLMKGKMEIKFNVSDLLAQPYIRFRNLNPANPNLTAMDDSKGTAYNPDWDWTLRKGNRGTSFSLSVGYKF